MSALVFRGAGTWQIFEYRFGGFLKDKVKRKISGCFRSDAETDAFHAIHPAWKNNQSPLDAIPTFVQ